MKGVKEGGRGGGHGGMGDIFDMFGMGGGGGGRGGPRKPQKGKPVAKDIKVTLEEVYNGKVFKIPHSRKKCCEGCDGKGGANQKKCSTCKGQGMVVKMQMLGPGMYQQSTQPCSDCMGQGVVVDEKDKCKKCNGKKLIDSKTQIECALEPGCPHEHSYI